MHTFLNLALLSEGEGGFNPLDPHGIGIAFWTWLIFLLSLPFIWKVVMGPVTKALEARDDQAAKAIVAAEDAKKGAESARAEVETKLAEANRQAAQIVEEARLRAESRDKQLAEQAKKEAAAMLERARSEIRAEQEKAVSAIRREVVDLSLNAAGTVIKRKIDATDDRRLVEELVASVKDGRS
ncbi:MAG: F0F1 ATP synthase subunit B [Planctomycetes bacterium]|nr:F0F1 ATP synthase subunit B [Planctomycetota bacterium]